MVSGNSGGNGLKDFTVVVELDPSQRFVSTGLPSDCIVHSSAAEGMRWELNISCGITGTAHIYFSAISSAAVGEAVVAAVEVSGEDRAGYPLTIYEQGNYVLDGVVVGNGPYGGRAPYVKYLQYTVS
ncbi:hypothetical protein [Dietzia maris]|uniref:hypothetical protein n=1 Tax=Dietzia maris TaxID=37915 RepID=UPI0037CAFB6B